MASCLASRLELSSLKRPQTLTPAATKSDLALQRRLPISQSSKARLDLEEPPGFLVGKGLTSKDFCSRSVMGMVRKVWKLRGSLRITEEDDRFIFRFGQADDARRVLLGGPWKFDDAPLILMPFDGISAASDVPLDSIGFWVQVRGVHVKFQTRENCERIGAALGTFVKLDEQQFRDGKIWIRVDLSLHYPILLGGPITMAGGVTLDLEFSYENIIGRCKRCGLLTHIGLPCVGPELPPITNVAQKVTVYKPPPPPALLLAVSKAAAPVKAVLTHSSPPPPPGFTVSLTPPAAPIESSSAPSTAGISLPPPITLVQDPSASNVALAKKKVKIIHREPPPQHCEKRSFDSMDIDESSPTVKKFKPALATGSSNFSVPPFEFPDELTLGNLFYTKQKKKPGRPRGSGNKNKLGVSGGLLKKSPKKKSPKKQDADKNNSPEKEDPAPEISAPSSGSEASA